MKELYQKLTQLSKSSKLTDVAKGGTSDNKCLDFLEVQATIFFGRLSSSNKLCFDIFTQIETELAKINSNESPAKAESNEEAAAKHSDELGTSETEIVLLPKDNKDFQYDGKHSIEGASLQCSFNVLESIDIISSKKDIILEKLKKVKSEEVYFKEVWDEILEKGKNSFLDYYIVLIIAILKKEGKPGVENLGRLGKESFFLDYKNVLGEEDLAINPWELIEKKMYTRFKKIFEELEPIYHLTGVAVKGKEQILSKIISQKISIFVIDGKSMILHKLNNNYIFIDTHKPDGFKLIKNIHSFFDNYCENKGYVQVIFSSTIE